MLEGLIATPPVNNILSLSTSDTEAFENAETTVKSGLAEFIQVGDALALIRDNGWYKVRGFSTFEEYCRDHWQLSRSRAYQLIEAASVVNQLRAAQVVDRNDGVQLASVSVSTIVDTPTKELESAGQLRIFEEPSSVATPAPVLPASVPLPATPSHALALSRVNASDRVEVWNRANEVADAEGRPVTAKLISEVNNPNFAAASAPAETAPASQPTPPAQGTSKTFQGLNLEWEGPIYRAFYHHRDDDGNDVSFHIEITESPGGWSFSINGGKPVEVGYLRGAEQQAERIISERIADGKAGVKQ